MKSFAYLVLPLAFAGMVLVLQFRPIHDTDVFWQVKLGELTLDHGLIDKEPFAALHAGDSLTPIAWLGQVVFALIYRLGGWSLLHTFDSLVWAAGFLAVARSVQRTQVSVGAVSVALALGFMAALPFASLRPQSFAVLGFGLLLALMRSEQTALRKLALAAPLLVLWQNLHPSVTVATAGAAGAAVFGWINYWRCRSTAKPWAQTWLTVLSGAASVATPAGFCLYTAAAYNAEMSRALAVSEWLPLWDSSNREASLPALAALALTLALLARNKKRIEAEDLGRAAILGAMMLVAIRFAPFWGLAMAPLCAECLSGGERPAPSSLPLGNRSPRIAFAWCLSFAIALGVPALARPRLFAEYIPLSGIARLKEEQVKGVIYCYPAWGGPLIQAGFPEWEVAYDGRYYVYSRQEWNNYLMAVRGEVPLTEIEQRYRPAAFFLQPNVDREIIQKLRERRDWVEIHLDGQCAVFVHYNREK